MITSKVSAIDDFGRVIDEVERRSKRALNDAARAAAQTFEERAAGIPGAEAIVIPAHGTHNGFAAGIRARGPLWRIFDKGSLGKRTARLKRNRRKDSWTVKRGDGEHTADRRDVDGKGIAARNISNPARTAGRKALIRGIRRP